MYCYKLNNSYTVYVDYSYINDCIKESKKYSKKNYSLKPCKKTYMTPPPEGTLVVHKIWGTGSLIPSHMQGRILVKFSDRTVKFVYPDAFEQGYLKRVYTS